MRRFATAWLACVAAMALTAMPAPLDARVPPAASNAAPSGAPTTLGARLRARGSARATFERRMRDLLTGELRREPGRLTLELPARARLEFTRTGERVTLRSDGGEWLQPRLSQMLILDASHASQASRWWRLLLDGQAPGITVERRGARTRVFHSSDGAGPDSAVLRIDAAGLPVSLEVPDIQGTSEFRFGAWSFGRASGEAAFRQKAPAGYDVIDLP